MGAQNVTMAQSGFDVKLSPSTLSMDLTYGLKYIEPHHALLWEGSKFINCIDPPHLCTGNLTNDLG